VQQLIHRIAMMSSDIEYRRGVDLAVNLSHRVVPIRHVEQLFNPVHQGTLESAGDAVVGQETMEQAKHRGTVVCRPRSANRALRRWMASVLSPASDREAARLKPPSQPPHEYGYHEFRVCHSEQSRGISILFPILPLGRSRTITAACQLLSRGLRSRTPCA